MEQRDAARTKSGQSPLFGVILGHTHIPDRRNLTTPNGRPFEYLNSGDWVDPRHCTALLERHNGTMSLVRWDNKDGIVDFQPQRPDSPAQSPDTLRRRSTVRPES